MLKTLILAVAVNLNTMSFQELETLYWDCDTLFMKAELGGEDMMSCLAITEQFQKLFWDRWVFTQYWNSQKKQQWLQRGYTHHDEHD